MVKAGTLVGIVLLAALDGSGQTAREPQTFFRDHIGLNDDQIAAIARGNPIVKVLPANTANEIFVFGAVFVNAAPEEYVKLAINMDRLRRLPGYLGIGRISNPPALSDLEGFSLEPEDIRDLRDCRPGQCEVQLPAEAM